MKIAILAFGVILAPPVMAQMRPLSVGEKAWVQCRACHTLEKDAPNKIGPNLYGIVNKPAGALASFTYSPTLKASGLVWDRATLDRWIQKPGAVLKGSRMVFIGIPDADKRAALIDFIANQKP